MVVRSEDKLVQRYLSIFLSSDLGEAAFKDLAKPTKSFGMFSVSIRDLRNLAIPSLTTEKMQALVNQETRKKDTYQGFSEGNATTSSTLKLDNPFRVSLKSNTVDFNRLESAQNQVRQLNETVKGLKEEAKKKDDTIKRLKTQELARVKEKNLSLPDNTLRALIRRVDYFLKSAEASGMVTTVNNCKICSGRTHSITVTNEGTSILENKDTGGILVYKRSQVLLSDRISIDDVKKFEELEEICSSQSKASFSKIVATESKQMEL